MRKTKIKSRNEAAPLNSSTLLPWDGFNNQALAQAYMHIPHLSEGQRQRGKGELLLIPPQPTSEEVINRTAFERRSVGVTQC